MSARRLSGETGREGRCYELAYRHALTDVRWAVVHGTARYCGEARMGHAWLRCGDRVYDPVLALGCSVEHFATLVDAREHIAYSARQAAHEALRTGHYGPWATDHPPCVVAEALR